MRVPVASRARIAALALGCGAVLGLSGEGWSEQRQASYRYAGVVRARSDEARVVTVETRHGLLDFHYLRPAQKQCLDFRAVKVGDAVQVISPTGRAPYSAACITKVDFAGEQR